MLNNRDANTPDQVIEQYLLALEKKDKHLMLQLVPGSYAADQAAEDKIDQFGGYKIQERQVNYIKPKTVFLIANVKGLYVNSDGVRKKFEDRLTIAYEGGGFLQSYQGRWCLLLGKGNVPPPEVQSAEPQTAPLKKSR
ncbi:MAG: hypothetical protein HC851_07690 [Acaryochloris sp. RU_4_1]|nr:hypothetical protein [Acaryochloris sp. RU_4_1]